MSGSMLVGTAAHRLDGIGTDLSVTAPGAAADELAAMVEQAERMCFVLDAIERSHTVDRRTTINGEPTG